MLKHNTTLVKLQKYYYRTACFKTIIDTGKSDIQQLIRRQEIDSISFKTLIHLPARLFLILNLLCQIKKPG